ncbi:lysozyme C-like [Archocentrus centrarchus]|uniref:lysozyme C-like n=1 Tax=Archocentrus centrarchus TaxID=63155 RepID=UPI0011EA3FF1|nr:lysozyme C-like [Archocentrus centrarchus]
MRSLIFVLLVAAASAKTFQRCEWARTLKARGMDGYRNVSLADWVCLTKWESSYNTMAKHHNNDGSTDFGIFQINSYWWCNDQIMSSKNGCNINCSELLSDDVTVAIKCAKRIVLEQGIRAWYGWLNHCDGRDLRPYLDGCGL